MAPAQGWHAKIENGIELRPAVQPLPGANPGGSLWHHKSKSHLQFWQVFWHTTRKRVQIHLHPSVWCLIIPTCQVSHNRILRFLVHNSRCFTFTYVPIQLSFFDFSSDVGLVQNHKKAWMMWQKRWKLYKTSYDSQLSIWLLDLLQ